MHRLGHYGAALLGYAPVSAIAIAFGFGTAWLLGGIAVIGLAMVPDLDQRIPGVPHRGPTHTVRFALGVGVLSGAVGAIGVWAVPSTGLLWVPFGAVFGATVGGGTILSHIAADALTPMGVEPFDDGRRYSYDLWRADSLIGNWLLLGAGVLAVALGATVGGVVHGAIFG